MYRRNIWINKKKMPWSNGTIQASVISNQNRSSLSIDLKCLMFSANSDLSFKSQYFCIIQVCFLFLFWRILKRTWGKRILVPHVYIKTNLSMEVLFYCTGWCRFKLPTFKVYFASIYVFLNFQMYLSKDMLFHGA